MNYDGKYWVSDELKPSQWHLVTDSALEAVINVGKGKYRNLRIKRDAPGLYGSKWDFIGRVHLPIEICAGN